jgi:hypothetical protein
MKEINKDKRKKRRKREGKKVIVPLFSTCMENVLSRRREGRDEQNVKRKNKKEHMKIKENDGEENKGKKMELQEQINKKKS